jgi:hypothetical protein
MAMLGKMRDKEQGVRQYHTIDVSDSRYWKQLRCNTYSVTWAHLGTSIAGCSREAWLFRLMLMHPQENAGLVSFLADYDPPICGTETG